MTKLKDKPMLSNKATGNCFEKTVHIMLNVDEETNAELGVMALTYEMRLCHGFVYRQQDKLRHVHAWIEAKSESGHVLCIDKSNGLNVFMNAERYYALGNIEGVVKYTRPAVRSNILKSGVYGPWDKRLKKGSKRTKTQ